MIEAGKTDAQGILSTNWLNAYNAPHWMNIGPQMQYQLQSNGTFVEQAKYLIPGWSNRQIGTNGEGYGTSWMRDLMVAKQYASPNLVQPKSWFNGSVDANLGKTPKGPAPVGVPNGIHVSHDLGMAFDLGVSNYIGSVAQSSQNEQLTIGRNDWLDPSDHTKGTVYSNVPDKNAYDNNLWSYDNAVYLSGLLPAIQSGRNMNNQVAALRDVLSLYAEVRSGTWDALKLASGNNAAEKVRIRAALFGDGTVGNALISKILIGTSKLNAYPNIHEILQRLGIADGLDLQHHFHVYLNPPAAVAIDATHNLLTDAASANAAAPDTTLQTEAQSLFDYAQSLTHTGDELMFIMDVPYVPAQQTPIVLAQAATPGAGSTPQPDYILKQCQETESTGDPSSAMRGVDPAGWLAVYIGNRDRRDIYGDHSALASIKTTLLEGTTHGNITTEVDNTGRTSYGYDPVPNYVGKDRAVFMAEFEGKRYKIVIDLRVFIIVDENNPTCPPPKLIKVTKPSSGFNGYDVNSINVTFSDLAAGALGQTTGTSITLDDNAVGNNWYIDNTPWDNSEFLPTSNPYEWVAKEGSAAYGKMDMLSVLLHEYGHALGIDHSADGHDYMATTLTTGVRRLPSAEELALMQQLVGEVKTTLSPTLLPGGGEGQNGPSQLPLLPLGGFGLAFLGRLRSTRYGSLNIEADLSTLVTQFAVTANAKLTNGNFSVASGMPVDNGWATQGSVDFVGGAATLKEVSTSQTRLNQVFVVNPRDRFLSFTIAGSVLDDVNGAPDDAFEAALLDANTGKSLAGAFSLTHSDAMLNLQADGTETAASSVTRVTNPDRSRTYRVDLSGIAVGTAVNLSFDLIGFGKDNSEVTVRDVRVSGLPELHDDAATMNEDGTLAFDPFAQVDNAALLQLGSHVVDQPAHGSVTVNPDGTFAYTPAADYFGTDTFTYRLNDGPLESNLATVTVTVSAVNDAPVAGDVYATLAEDTPLQITLGAHASDVDSTTLSIQIVDGPTHGVLVANADGSYTYTAEANYFGPDSFTYQANDGQLDSNVARVNLTITPVNDAPVANDVAVYTLEENQLVLNLLTSASDIDSPALTATIVSAPAHGILTQNADGSYTYTPDANYNGMDSFTYKVNDAAFAGDSSALDSNIASVSLTVGAVNDAPTGTSTTVTTLEDTPYVFRLADFGYSDANDLVGAQASRLQADGTSAIQWDNFLALTIGSLPQAESTKLVQRLSRPEQL